MIKERTTAKLAIEYGNNAEFDKLKADADLCLKREKMGLKKRNKS